MLNVYIYKIGPVKDTIELPSHVLRHVNKYTNKEAKASSLFAWTKVCDLLDDYDFDFKRLSFKNDEPVIKNSKIWFSLSHSGKCVAIAISDNPVGIDIQKNVDKKSAEAIADKFLTVEQQKHITGPNKELVCTTLFVCFEAVYKMRHFMRKNKIDKNHLINKFNLIINKEKYSLCVVNSKQEIISFDEIESTCNIKENKK